MSGLNLLKNKKYFPTFSDLPDEGDVDLRFIGDLHGNKGIVYPSKHWCLLVEIVSPIPYLRPMWEVKDKSGRKFLIAFYLDAGEELPNNFLKHAKTGNTISVMDAEQHHFVDGQCGLRIEDGTCVKSYPCNLQTFLGLGGQAGSIMAKKQCQSCNSDTSPKWCGVCNVRYCNEECQRQHWQARHKRECRAIAQINDWKGKNWADFNERWNHDDSD